MTSSDQQEMQKSKELFKQLVSAYMPEPGAYETGLSGVTTYNRNKPTVPSALMYKPMIVKIVQGRKHVIMGEHDFFYNEDNVFVTGVDMPGVSMVCNASEDSPCLSIAVELDAYLISQLALEMPSLPHSSIHATKGIHVQPIEPDLLDAFIRLTKLFMNQEKIAILGPMIIREIHYLLLSGPEGHKLRSFHTLGSQNNQIAQTISWLKSNLSMAINVEELAEKVNMAPSTFHRHFKEVTTLSPIQFQKRLRLHEAQRLMLTQDLDANTAGITVGYDSLSQFNREYKRLFGDPPKKDVLRIKQKVFLPESSMKEQRLSTQHV